MMTNPPPEVSQLKDMIEYQKNSVVSKEIIKKKTGTITLFAFDVGQGLSEHTAPFDTLVQVLEGEAKVTISGNPFVLKKDESIMMPARKPHALHATKKFKMLLTMVKE